ncbi:patatin-like phospholipase family protein [Veronia pacifica]|uniref:PNPLA domain-containing protein n=1 Tax=Veronia pacifica TaxID=1080227 RepID=A0A1C3EJ87_9GAMM|nr:hypothetical protein A8L45_10870 [Veronia pacifica]
MTIEINGKKRKVCLVLQGGGALGAYQIGVYKALEEEIKKNKDFDDIDWFAGISIGAINATLLAANEQSERLNTLENFWDRISYPMTDPTEGFSVQENNSWMNWGQSVNASSVNKETESFLSAVESFWQCNPFMKQFVEATIKSSPIYSQTVLPTPFAFNDNFSNLGYLFNWMNVSTSLLLGQPDFFTPRLPWVVGPLTSAPGTDAATSFYDTTPLKHTLKDMCTFELLNDKAEGNSSPRLTVGATRVTDGELVFFDSENKDYDMGPEHAVASGSLPPAFPATKIEEDYYWDGGVVSNTPLNGILDLAGQDEELLIFMVDLWNPNGERPSNLSDVAWRQKEIQYASRAAAQIDSVVAKHNLKHLQAAVADSNDPSEYAKVHGRNIDIVHITFNPFSDHTWLSDTEFSRRSIRRRSEAGYEDMKLALAASPWTQEANKYEPVRLFTRKNKESWECKSQESVVLSNSAISDKPVWQPETTAEKTVKTPATKTASTPKASGTRKTAAASRKPAADKPKAASTAKPAPKATSTTARRTTAKKSTKAN